MCALTIEGTELKKLENGFSQIMASLESNYPNILTKSLELHAGEIYNGKGPWREAFTGNRQRYEILNQFVQMLSSLDLRILVQGIDLLRQSQKYSLPIDPRYLSLKFLIEKVDKELHKTSDTSILICDAGASRQQIEYIRNLLTEMQRDGGGGHFPWKVSRIVDTVHFSDSKWSRGIQATDLVAFLCHRAHLQSLKFVKVDPGIEHLWQVLTPKIVYQRIWVP
jgi:Protein of unknown function (DUF3800)